MRLPVTKTKNPFSAIRPRRKGLKALPLLVLATSYAAHVSAASADSPAPFNKLNVDLSTITVSGLSSGGFMATQMHIAHSDWVKGAGIIAAAPYNCARNSLKTALSDCIGEPASALPMQAMAEQINAWESDGKIAAFSNLKDGKVWILGGTLDKKIGVKLVSALSTQYQQWVDAGNVKTSVTKPFSHHFPTQTSGSDCKKSETPFIGNCSYDAAGEIFSHLYSGLQAPTRAIAINIKKLDVSNLPEAEQASTGDNAYVYVPTACAQGEQCQVHVSFHGCNQNSDTIGLDFVTQTGINRWAESNKLVVLYPQTKSSNVMPFNPQGCWDWWGYTDANYATRSGKQIQAVSAMVKALKK